MKNEKEKTITRKEKKFRSIGTRISVTKRRETQRFYTSFINTGLYKYNHLSLSYISSTSTDAVPNKYISKPSIPKRTWSKFFPAIFRECQHIALEKKKKVRPRSTELTFITKSTNTALGPSTSTSRQLSSPPPTPKKIGLTTPAIPTWSPTAVLSERAVT